MSIQNKIMRNLRNVPGWRTNRKIIVIESDDWGSIRMPSRNCFNNLNTKGIDLKSGDSQRYNLYDTLANKDDLTSLFEVLARHRDFHGAFAKFTAMCVVANPDFDKIKESGFKSYYYEPFTDTLKKYYQSEMPFDQWKKGIESHLFIPQFHGREHLNVTTWLKNLQSGDKHTLEAFKNGLWGFNRNSSPEQPKYQAAFDVSDSSEIPFLEEILADGLNLFETIFGYRATYFVPPNGPINNILNKTAANCGIKYRSTSKIQKEPYGNGIYKNRLHYLGQENEYGQIYLTRNAFFEPNKGATDWIDSCLADIQSAFAWHKPAIISAHRVNFIGVHDPANRHNGLTKLDLLLSTILKKWPDTEFLSSDELGQVIKSESKS
jgi:hypothetical protein